MKAGTYTIADFAGGIPRGNARTSEVYRRTLGRLEAAIGKPLTEASLRDVLELKKALRARTSGPYAANLLRMFYRAAARATDTPRLAKLADELRLQQRVKRLSPDDILTLPEVDRMMKAASSLRDRALIVALWETGARIHEVLAVNLGDVREMDLPEGNGGGVAYRIFFRKTKVAGEEHGGYILDGADHFRAWLQAYTMNPPDDAPLFVSYHQNRLSYTAAFSAIRKTALRAGITKRVYPHLFRHSRATHLLRMNVPEAHVKKLLGWTPASPMLARYAHLAAHDSYMALLKAGGYGSPPPVDLGRLTAAEGNMRAVVPLAKAVPRPAPPSKMEGQHADLMRALISEMSKNPDVLRHLRAAIAGLPG